MISIGLDNINQISSIGKDKKVGLITNHTGLNHNFISNIEIFKKLFQKNFIRVFTPEHGLYGDEQAGIPVKSYYDSNLNIEITSLYGNSSNTDDIDLSMRENDTSYFKKNMPLNLIDDIDVLFFDLQDVGTRIYTYVSTMILSMEACMYKNKEFVVLDRPNPISGSVEGPILNKKFRSFIGIMEIPIRHGMTVGELANFYNYFYLNSSVNLKIIKMEKWKRNLYYNKTGLPWIMPSPNMPALNSAIVYPGQVLFEGINISEGRGTTKPFEIIGSPWIDSYKLSKKINSSGIKGAKFREVHFIPEFSKYKNNKCHGIEIYITNINQYKPYFTSLKLIKNIMEMSYDNFEFYDKYFDMVNGTDEIRKALVENIDIDNLIKDISNADDNFIIDHGNILLY